MKDLHIENCKTLLNKIKEDEWQPVFMGWKLNSAKIPVLPKAVYRLSAIPIKIPVMFFAEIEKCTLQLKDLRGYQVAKTILKNKIGELTQIFSFSHLFLHWPGPLTVMLNRSDKIRHFALSVLWETIFRLLSMRQTESLGNSLMCHCLGTKVPSQFVCLCLLCM